MTKKEEAIEVDGVVTEALANTRFRVQLDSGHKVIAHVAGRMPSTSSASCRATRSASSCRPTI